MVKIWRKIQGRKRHRKKIIWSFSFFAFSVCAPPTFVAEPARAQGVAYGANSDPASLNAGASSYEGFSVAGPARAQGVACGAGGDPASLNAGASSYEGISVAGPARAQGVAYGAGGGLASLNAGASSYEGFSVAGPARAQGVRTALTAASLR